MNKLLLKTINNWLTTCEPKDLKEIVKGLDSQTYDKLFWSIMDETVEEFEFNMKDYMNDWKPEFDERYTSLDREIIVERLELTQNNVDLDLTTEYHYLQYWFDKESEVGGMFNYF